MAEGYKSRHTGAAIDNAVGRVERVPAAENDKYLHINASGEPEWSSIVVDDAMSSSSENPVQNKVVKSYIDGLASTALQRKIVTALPVQDIETNVVYMILKQDGEVGDFYNEYMYINNQWELIGSTQMRVDSALSLVSENSVQNKVVTAALNEKLSKTEFEELSDGFKLSSERIPGGLNLGSITVNEDAWNIPEVVADNALSDVSENPVQNKVVKAALDAQKVTVDSDLNASSENPVQNKVIKAALDLKANAAEIDPLSLTVSTTRSNDPSALNAQSFILDDGTTETIYNLPREVLVDATLNASSENSVQNKVVTAALNEKLSKTEFEELSDGFKLSSERIPGGLNLGSITVNEDAWNIPEVVADNALSDVSENPVQNKVVKAALDAQKVTVDSDLNASSENPVQNKVITAALDSKANASEINAMSVVFSENKSTASSAIELKSFTVTQGGVDTTYNLPESSVVDSEMSSTSENPVQNKVIYAALQNVPSTSDVQSMIDTAIQGAINRNY